MSASARRHFSRLHAGLETAANNGKPPSTTADLLERARAWRTSRLSSRTVAPAPAYTAYFSLAAKLHKEKWTVQEIARFLQESVPELQKLKLSTLGQGLRRHLDKQRPKTPASAS